MTKSKKNVKNTSKAKEKYRGVFEIQKSGDKTSSGEIGLDIGTKFDFGMEQFTA